MTATKKLSVIIPMFNVADCVARAARSIAVQQSDKLEIVLVDDGSVDDSLQVCMENLYCTDVVVIKQPNKGLSGARNAGIWASSGEYVLFLDADDFLLPNAIVNICTLLESSQPDVLFGRYLRWSPEGGFYKSKPYNYQPPNDPTLHVEYILDALPEPSWNAWRYVCRRRFLIEYDLFFEQGLFCEDIPWTLALLNKASSIEFLQEPFYAYFHRRPQSILFSMNTKRFIDLNHSVSVLLREYANQPAICRQLVWQSFLYINEYCQFGRDDRKLLLDSYRMVLPLYTHSTVKLHHIAGKCSNQILMYLMSIVLFLIKHVRSTWMRIMERNLC